MTQQRQTQAQEQRQAAYRHDNENQSFAGGVMHVDGVPLAPTEVVHWLSSNRLTTYTTVAWRDPATGDLRTSCNCPGWTIKKRNQHRRCKHTDDMEGVKPCRDERVSGVQITSVDQAVSEIPDLVDGKELRALDLL